MRFSTRLRYELIRTPLQVPLMRLQHALSARHLLRHPELARIHREPALIRVVMKRALRADSWCIDVGCHYGSVLAEMLRLAPRGRHVAFEPDSEKVEFLRRKFRDVDVRNKALSNRSGTVPFYVDHERSAFSGLSERGGTGVERRMVGSSTLDAELERHERADFLKVDVEGAETLVFRGGVAALTRLRPLVLFECGPSHDKPGGVTARDCYRVLTEECGYSVYFLDAWLEGRGAVGIEEFASALTYPFQAFNWMASPRP